MKWSEMSERERDMLVADKVMGWTRCTVEGTREQRAYGAPSDFDESDPVVRIDEFTTNIADAWRVAEKIKFAGPHKHISIGYQNGYWSCWIMGVCEEIATSASEAICIAALKACGVEIE